MGSILIISQICKVKKKCKNACFEERELSDGIRTACFEDPDMAEERDKAS